MAHRQPTKQSRKPLPGGTVVVAPPRLRPIATREYGKKASYQGGGEVEATQSQVGPPLPKPKTPPPTPPIPKTARQWASMGAGQTPPSSEEVQRKWARLGSPGGDD